MEKQIAAMVAINLGATIALVVIKLYEVWIDAKKDLRSSNP